MTLELKPPPPIGIYCIEKLNSKLKNQSVHYNAMSSLAVDDKKKANLLACLFATVGLKLANIIESPLRRP